MASVSHTDAHHECGYIMKFKNQAYEDLVKILSMMPSMLIQDLTEVRFQPLGNMLKLS